MGAADYTATPYCTVYLLLVTSFGYSNVIALLPLTIDRTVAVIFPLRHRTIITHKTCALMLGSVWLSITIVLINYLVDFSSGSVGAVYLEKYHRCIFSGKTLFTESMCLFIIPFVLILLMYGSMLFMIVKTKRSCGRFLFLSFGIIGSNLLCFTPGVFTDLGILRMGYEATLVIDITFWYVNGVINPLLYVAIHPRTAEFVKKRFGFT